MGVRYFCDRCHLDLLDEERLSDIGLRVLDVDSITEFIQDRAICPSCVKSFELWWDDQEEKGKS